MDLELAAASLRADGSDVRILVKVLADQLSDALGTRLEVQRAGGRFRKSDEIRSLRITMGDDQFDAEVDGDACAAPSATPRGASASAARRWPSTVVGPAAGRPQGRGGSQPGGPSGSRDHGHRRNVMSETPQDLPEGASHRLEELEHGLFTSDLSVNEFLLIKEVGFHPLGFVMGSSIYHTGIQTRKWGQSQELTKLTGAMYDARELAMTRMEEEAAELGADGVVGRPARRQLLRVGQGRRRVHRRGDGGEGRERGVPSEQARASRSPPTCRARTSGR